VRIALDAMGGDHAPEAVVQGALEAAATVSADILLVGPEQVVRDLLPAGPHPRISIVDAKEVVAMDEKPMEALRLKRASSISVAVELVKRGEADAFVSAGNTGACTAASLLAWRTIEGAHRPAIASPFPSRTGQFVLLDAGASPDVEPESLVEFAHMGRAYATSVWNRPNPTVHLLNIGEEPGKGNAFSKQAYDLLSGHTWFAGNIEGKDMFDKPCDVVVCDAFVGNVALKTAQGVAELVFREIRDQVPTGLGRLLYLPMKRALAPMTRKLDYAEYGGSPLLGLNHLCMICHGRSNARAIRNALNVTHRALERDIVGQMRSALARPMEVGT